MALTLSNSISGEFLPSESSGFFVYALRRDADNMLHFSKVSAASTELGEFYRTNGTSIPEFGDGVDYGCYDVGVGKTSAIRNDIATDKNLQMIRMININRSALIEGTSTITQMMMVFSSSGSMDQIMITTLSDQNNN